MSAPAPQFDSLPADPKVNDYLLCVVDSSESARAILDDLLYANLLPGSVMVFQPELSDPSTDDDGVLHTTVVMFQGLARALDLSERDANGYLRALGSGGIVVAAHAGNAVDQDNVLSIYREHGGTCRGFWGRRLTWRPSWPSTGAA